MSIDGEFDGQPGPLHHPRTGRRSGGSFHLRDEGDRYRLGLFALGADELADRFMSSGGGYESDKAWGRS